MSLNRKTTAVVGASLAVVTACSPHNHKPTAEQLPTPSFSTSPSPEDTVPLLTRKPDHFERNRSAVQHVAATALNRFEHQLSKGPANIWLFAGSCAVIAGQPDKRHPMLRLMSIAANPGVLHIVDHKSGDTVTEGLAWSSVTDQFVTGVVTVINKEGKAYIEPWSKDQHNDYFENSGPVVAKVQFSDFNGGRQLVKAGSRELVMDSVTSIGHDQNQFAKLPAVRDYCAEALEHPAELPKAPEA